jgi:hypothetical protein
VQLLLGVLQEITLDFCKKYSIPTAQFTVGLDQYELPINPLVNGHGFLLGGPVDFKFSTGYAGRLLVELKLSKGKVVQGYEEQLETYKAAAQTEEALFLIIDVGKMGTKLTKIKKIQTERQALGARAADIVVVDAKRRPSASKR